VKYRATRHEAQRNNGGKMASAFTTRARVPWRSAGTVLKARPDGLMSADRLDSDRPEINRHQDTDPHRADPARVRSRPPFAAPQVINSLPVTGTAQLS